MAQNQVPCRVALEPGAVFPANVPFACEIVCLGAASSTGPVLGREDDVIPVSIFQLHATMPRDLDIPDNSAFRVSGTVSEYEQMLDDVARFVESTELAERGISLEIWLTAVGMDNEPSDRLGV